MPNCSNEANSGHRWSGGLVVAGYQRNVFGFSGKPFLKAGKEKRATDEPRRGGPRSLAHVAISEIEGAL